MEDQNWWLERATVFQIHYNAKIERRCQTNGAIKWAVTNGEYVLNRQGQYEYEPLPSSRTDEFIARTRFDSKEEALIALKHAAGYASKE